MTLIALAPILMALCLVFIPLLSDGPPGPPEKSPRRKSPAPLDPIDVPAGHQARTEGALAMRHGCHLHGLAPQPNRFHPLEPS